MKRKLNEQVEHACRAFRMAKKKLFEAAFLTRNGRRRGVLREARAAYAKWVRGRRLSRRAIDIILGYIAALFASKAQPAAV